MLAETNSFRNKLPSCPEEVVCKQGKVYAAPKACQHEGEVWDKIKPAVDENVSLVPLELVQIASADIEVGDISGGSTYTRLNSTSYGLLMPHYSTTLSQQKFPISSKLLLRYGLDLRNALRHMHNRGYCHLDIKPPNIFLQGRRCYLGDYGAAAPIGGDIVEVSRHYFPQDAEYKAEPRTDFLLLVVTLMEVHADVPSPPSSMTSTQIRQKVKTIGDEQVRDFLLSLIEVADEQKSSTNL
jgi:hypothetical protein